MATILLVDDEPDLLESISFNLQRRGHHVVPVTDGDAALHAVRKTRPDLIILDLLLPRKPGREVATILKSDPQLRSIPIIMLTALSGESDIVTGFHYGADDYVTKPFSMHVLMARVEAALRRRPVSAPTETAVTHAGPVQIDRSRHIITVDGSIVGLTLTEFRLLDALVAAKSRVLSRDRLMSIAMGPDVSVTDRTIDVHITSLRRKLGTQRNLIETVRGVGYRFVDVWTSEPDPD